MLVFALNDSYISKRNKMYQTNIKAKRSCGRPRRVRDDVKLSLSLTGFKARNARREPHPSRSWAMTRGVDDALIEVGESFPRAAAARDPIHY